MQICMKHEKKIQKFLNLTLNDDLVITALLAVIVLLYRSVGLIGSIHIRPQKSRRSD